MNANAELIKQAEELFKLKVEEYKFSGLVYPQFGDGICAYNEPALEVWGHIIYERDDKFIFEGGIRSIDDSGMTLHSKPEEKEKALYRLNKWRDFIEQHSYACPVKEDIELFGHMINVHAEYW